MKYVFLLSLIIAIGACTLSGLKNEKGPEIENSAPRPDPSDPRGTYETDEESIYVLDWGHPQWTRLAELQVKENLSKFEKAKDVSKYCSKYSKLSEKDRILVWLTLAVEVARYESDFEPTSKMQEADDSISQGLFQLTYGDRFCPKKKSDADLNDPGVNIACAIKLMSHLIEQDEVVASGGYVKYGAPAAKGAARYWAVLRCKDSKSKHHLDQIMAATNALSFCS